MERRGRAHVPTVDRVPPDAATVVGMATFSIRNIGGTHERVPALGMFAMPQVQETILQHLGKALHAHDGDIIHEPLPPRWVDLIHHLDEQERRRGQDRRLELERSLPEPPPNA
jgi:hypothetical protein